MTPSQLTLGIALRDEATFQNFYAGDNAQVVATLEKLTPSESEQFIFLWGESGVGRTHLLQACCHTFSCANQTSMYLPLQDTSLSPDVLTGIEQMQLVCLDDIDTVLGHPAWEEALFHFYNRARENGCQLLVSAKHPPKQLPCQLPDLASRLAWGLVLPVNGLSDEDTLKALQMRARNRGIEISSEVGNYLLHHYPRNMGELFTVLERLDKASMVEKRVITVPFVKKVLS